MRPCACYGESSTSSFLLPLLLDKLPGNLGLPADLQDGQSPDGYPGPLFVGDPASTASALSALKSFLRNERIVTCFIRVHPLQGLAPDAFRSVGEVVQRGYTIPIPLDTPYREIQRNMRRDHRRDIRTAASRGYRTVFDDWDLLPEFVRLYRELMERVDAAEVYRYSDDYFAGLRGTLGESAHLAFVVNPAGAPAAGTIFTMCSGIVQYHLAVSDPAFKKDAPQKLVVDSLIRWGMNHGARVVHLGGGVGAKDDTLLDFKSGFSRYKLAYHTIHITSDPDAAERARIAWVNLYGSEPPDPGFFPIYRARRPVDD